MKLLRKGLVFGIIGLFIGAGLSSSVYGTDYFEKEENNVYVDPDVQLTRIHIPLLKNTMNQNTDPVIDLLLKDVIKIIEKNGSISSDELNQLIQQYDNNIYIHMFKNIHITRTEYALSILGFIASYLSLATPEKIPIPFASIFFWTRVHGDMIIGSKTYDTETGPSITIIGFIGTAQVICHIPAECFSVFDGFGFLIIVREF